MLRLTTEIAQIKGLPPRFLNLLKKLKIATVKDLLWHFPFRYEDFSTVVKIADLKANDSATVSGLVKKVSTRRSWRRNIFIIEAVIADETGAIKAIWFNQPYIAKILQPGRQVNFAGKVSYSNEEMIFSNPSFELAGMSQETKHTAGLIPVYSETKGLTSKGLRFLIKAVLKNLETLKEFLPAEVLKKNHFPEVNLAFRGIHFPKTIDEAEWAKKRFAFADLFLIQLNNLKSRLALAKEKAPPLKIEQSELDRSIKNLPFELTKSQFSSLREILDDLSAVKPMNRLLQGDVGSGKTVVAAIASLVSARNNKQTAFMAPTEVLARQHYKTLTKIFENFSVSIGLLTGSEARSFYGDNLEGKIPRPRLLQEISDGTIKIIIGTHAIISGSKDPSFARGYGGQGRKSVTFKDLALAIVDEQHRFGVQQRAALVKQEKQPGDETTIHFLSMSATPIPRTLSLTLFGDLDLSIISELPSGRHPIVTKVVAPANRQKAYDFVRQQIKAGRQAFVICPRIELSETRTDADLNTDQRRLLWAEVKNVTEEFERLSKKVFPDLRVAMLHGKMKSGDKAKIMSDFAAGQIDILVSTSVVEVGVDVPNAAIMMIEGADRFGLAQLYQFRGRVGRGEHQSFCLLFTDSSSQSTHQRLNALLKAKNGFELAEEDLKIRGPGQFIGSKQTGMPDLAMKSLNNIELIKIARDAAVAITEKDPELKNYPILRTALSAFQEKIHLE